MTESSSSKQNTARQRHAKEIAELRSAALAELENQGYDIRGKTPAQIREMLKRRRFKGQKPGPK